MNHIHDDVMTEVKERLEAIWARPSNKSVQMQGQPFYLTGTCGDMKIFTARGPNNLVIVTGNVKPVKFARYSIEQFYDLTNDLVMDWD